MCIFFSHKNCWNTIDKKHMLWGSMLTDVHSSRKSLWKSFVRLVFSLSLPSDNNQKPLNETIERMCPWPTHYSLINHLMLPTNQADSWVDKEENTYTIIKSLRCLSSLPAYGSLCKGTAWRTGSGDNEFSRHRNTKGMGGRQALAVSLSSVFTFDPCSAHP